MIKFNIATGVTSVTVPLHRPQAAAGAQWQRNTMSHMPDVKPDGTVNVGANDGAKGASINAASAHARSSLETAAEAIVYGSATIGQSVTVAGGSLRAEDVFEIGRSAAAALDKNVIEPRRKAAFAVADFHKDMLRLKADLETLGKAADDGKHYTLSQPKAIALMLILLRKWHNREITTVSGKEVTFQHWRDLLVDVKEKHRGANRDPVLLLDVEAVLAQLVTKFVPKSLAGQQGLSILNSLSIRSRDSAEKRDGADATLKEAAWLQQILTSNDKKFLEQAATDLGFGNKKDNPQEAKIPASQWNAIVSRLDAEVSPWQTRLNATMQRAQHDLGMLKSFYAKLGEIIRSIQNDARSALH